MYRHLAYSYAYCRYLKLEVLLFLLAKTGDPELLVLQLRPKESCDRATGSQSAQPKYDGGGAGL